MLFRWLKRFLPRGLFARALLILIVPLLVVQIVVSVVFVQRTYDRVTAQMTRSVAIPLRHVLGQIDRAGSVDEAAAVAEGLGGDLGFTIALPGPEVAEARPFYDLSGRSVMRTLRETLPAVGAIDLAGDSRHVRLSAATRWGPAEVRFARARVSASNPHQPLVIVGFTALLMTALAVWFLRNQVRPVALLAEAMEAYGRGLVLPYRVRGAAEVRAAGAAFLEMRARIERAREQRNALLSGVSHDLRTPLTRLRLGLSMAEDAAAAAEMMRDVADMERMVEDFLALARGEALAEAEPTDPAALAARVVANAGRLGRAVSLEAAEGASAPVMLRPQPVERALDNLVQNALRHARRVAVRVEAGGGWLRFVVEDDGPGIPAERRAEALRPFTRLDPARNQDRGGGAGLGLAIALDVARTHGGTLRLADSEALGGLRAELVLPR
jgi:two-component system osmolarity sensor histidine kinase EnvZ